MIRRSLRNVSAVAALDDATRRQVYVFVRERGAPTTRDDVAAGVGITRKLAAFHLDKLLERGLLRASYARLPGRSGPGAGRSSKLYEPSDLQVDVSIPERHYDLAGAMLVDAILEQRPGEDARAAALRVAKSAGRDLGASIRKDRGLRALSGARALTVAEESLADLGYEPYRADRNAVALRNCPFHALAQRAPELVCAMNKEFLDTFMRGIGAESVRAVLECLPGDCCVTLRSERPSGKSAQRRRQAG